MRLLVRSRTQAEPGKVMVVGGPSNERGAPCQSANLITMPPIPTRLRSWGRESIAPIFSFGFGNRWRPALLTQCLAPKDGLHDKICLENLFV